MGKTKVRFDYSELRGRIKSKNMTEGDLAIAIGIKAPTLSIKLNNGSYFNQEEMDKIGKALSFGPENYGHYFFNTTV